MVFAPVAEARGLSIQGAPAWAYEHSIEREKNLVVSVSHYIAPKDVAFDSTHAARLRFACSLGPVSEAESTPTAPTLSFVMKTDCSGDCDYYRELWGLTKAGSGESGRLDFRVDSHEVLTLRVRVTEVHFADGHFLIGLPARGNDSLANYMRGGSLLRLRMRGGHRIRETDITGVDTAVAYLTDQCHERQKTVHPRSDPFYNE